MPVTRRMTPLRSVVITLQVYAGGFIMIFSRACRHFNSAGHCRGGMVIRSVCNVRTPTISLPLNLKDPNDNSLLGGLLGQRRQTFRGRFSEGSLWPPFQTKVEPIRLITATQHNVVRIDVADLIPLDAVAFPQNLIADDHQSFLGGFSP